MIIQHITKTLSNNSIWCFQGVAFVFLGGQVLDTSAIPDELPVDMVVVATQKECDKGSGSPGITMAYQRNWKIVSPGYVLDTKDQALPRLEKYLLSIDKIQAAPGTSAVHTKVATVAETHFKRCGAFRDLKQTLHCKAKGTERLPKKLEPELKRSHHKKRTAKATTICFCNVYSRDVFSSVCQQLQRKTVFSRTTSDVR